MKTNPMPMKETQRVKFNSSQKTICQGKDLKTIFAIMKFEDYDVKIFI